ncbi:hypothetical protein [Paenirhodobacter enshiensis]|uniref:hypothetical protein n=1 Tax=Paenirhodobacter enshiensis TaxID=1105367 RepID=UPI003FA1C2F5
MSQAAAADPWWADPRVVQGFLTFLAALVAAGSALIVAFFAYPAQKNKDRGNEIMRERRDTYRALASAYEDFRRDSLRNWFDPPSDFPESVLSFFSLRRASGQLLISAPDAVCDRCHDFISSAAELGKYLASNIHSAERNDDEFRKEVDKMNDAFAQCLELMRRDTFENSSVIFKNFFPVFEAHVKFGTNSGVGTKK